MPNSSNHEGNAEPPNISKDMRPKLLSLAAAAGRNAGVINEILLFLNAHPVLMDLPRVIQGLMNTLDAIDKPPKLSIGESDRRVWRNECEWIIQNRANPTFVESLGPQFYSEDSLRDSNPVIGQGIRASAFPYATLWHEPADSDTRNDYYRLVGQLLAGYKKNSGKQNLLVQEYAAYLALRKLCKQQVLSIPAELNIALSFASFVKSCRKFAAGKSNDPLAGYYPSITRLGRYYDADKPAGRTGRGATKRGKSNEAGFGVLISQGASEFPLEDPDDPDLLPGYISFVRSLPPSIDLDEALPTDELTAKNEICLIDTGGVIKPYVAELLSHQGMLDHITRARQFLSFGFDLLTMSELANLLFGVSEEFHRCRKHMRNAEEEDKQKPFRRRMEALLVLHLMLWFGRSIEDCKKLRIAASNDHPSRMLELIPVGALGQPEFRLFANIPSYTAEEQMPREAVRVPNKTITVPDMVDAASLVMALKEFAQKASDDVFSLTANELEREVRAVLRELGGGDPRYTMTKVRSYLHRQIIASSNDVVGATMLSGTPCLSANTPLYYTQYSVNYLRNLYCRTVKQVLIGVYACVGLEAPSYKLPQDMAGAVGARNCMRLEAIKLNLEALLQVLRKRPRENLKQLVHWHNCLTLWSVQMFMMATGCRAIRNPLKRVAEFDPASGYGALGDKGADDGHMSRLVVLPKQLHQQLQAYQSHCSAVQTMFEHYLSGQDVPSGGYFLSLFDDGQVSYKEIRPQTICAVMREVEGYTPHPVNGFRKVVRTELGERGCSPETLAAYMGHWLSGEEPQDVYSTFCPRTYVKSLHTYLLPLMGELGWMVRNSHLVQERGA